MQEVRNDQGKLICMADSRTKTIEIAIKGCVTKIRFSDDGKIIVQNSDRKIS